MKVICIIELDEKQLGIVSEVKLENTSEVIEAFKEEMSYIEPNGINMIEYRIISNDTKLNTFNR